jgi:hydrogenase maturation protease
MTLRVRAAPDRERSVVRSVPRPAAVVLEVLVCGSAERGDESAPLRAQKWIVDLLPPRVAIRFVGQLSIDDLLAVPAGASVIVVDAATGARAGTVIELPLTGFLGRDDGLRPRSCQALTFPEVLGLAELIRGRPLRGEIVVIAGLEFGHGKPLSWPVSAAMPALVTAVTGAIDRHRTPA